jgi:hypothetical protein
LLVDVVGRDKTRGDAVVAEIRAVGRQADFVAAELDSADAARGLAAEATRLLGQVSCTG